MNFDRYLGAVYTLSSGNGSGETDLDVWTFKHVTNGKCNYLISYNKYIIINIKYIIL